MNEILFEEDIQVLESQDTNPKDRLMNIEAILRIVAREFGVAISLIQSNSREYTATVPRQIAQIFATMIPGYTLAKVGNEIGDKDHSTVSHSLKTATGLYEILPEYRARVNNIRDRLRITEFDFNRHIDRWRK